ncbi:MAG: discoidin domain-containing protein [Clostridia bacterium]|nr:discoidin domain-containing protein [Clostridia bacterium]
MRKSISFLLVISLLASLFVFPAGALAKANELLVSESFNGIVTGTAPEGNIVTSGRAIVVVTKEGKEKGLELSKYGSETTIYMETAPKGNIVSLYMDLKYTNGWSKTEFSIQNGAGKQYVLATIADDGALTVAGGKRVATFPKGIDSSIQIVYDMTTKRATIYVGKNCVMNNRYLASDAHTDIVGFGVKVVGSPDKSLILDNLAAFDGYAPVKSSNIPKAAYLEDAVEIAEPDSGALTAGEYVGDAVYISRSFDEEGIPPYDTFTVGGIAAVSIEKSIFNENKYLQIKKTEQKESYLSFSGNPDGNYMVLEVDLSTDTSIPAGRLLQTRDDRHSQMFTSYLSMTTDGSIKLFNSGDVIGKIEPMKWTHLGVTFDKKQHTFDVYINGELVADDAKIAAKDHVGYAQFRMGCDKNNNTGTLFIDNLKLYDGKDFRDIDYTVRKSRPKKDTVARNSIDMNKAVSPFSSTYYTDLAKYHAKHDMLLEKDDEMVYMHKEDLEVMYGAELKLEGAHATQEGYYDARATAKASGYIETVLDTRLYIYSKAPVDLTEDQILDVYRYMFHERPTADDLIKLFNEHNKNQRPRVLMNADDFAKIKATYQTDPYMKKWFEQIKKSADAMIGRPPYTYKLTGTSMADVSESVTEIGNICLVYLLTKEEKYLTTIWDFLENICKMKDFSPAGYLDYGELPFVLAVGYDWLYDYWTEEQRELLRNTIYEKAVEFTYRMYHNEFPEKSGEMYTTWWDGTSNFNGVINGGLIATSIAILDTHPEVSARLIEISKKALEYFVDAYYPDGAWHEGNAYWSYSMLHFTHGIKSMENAFGTNFGLYNAPGISKTGLYASQLAGTTNGFMIGDAGAASFVNNHTLSYLATYYNDAELMGVRKNEYDVRNHDGNYHDMIYYNPELMKTGTTLDLDSFMDGLEVITLREAWYDAGATSVNMVGPINRRTHGHMDAGSFQLDMAGERFFQESGAENYKAKGGYFSSGRYKFYKSRPEGHNVYIINPKNDIEYFGQDVKTKGEGQLVVSKPRGAIGVMDLTPVYATWASKATRGMMLSDDRRSVTIRDEIDLLQPNSEVYWFAHTYADKIEFPDAKTAVLTLNGKKIMATMDTNGTDVEFKVMDPVTLTPVTEEYVTNTDMTKKGFKKLAIVCKGTGRLNITVKFKQFDDEIIEAKPTTLDISQWTIPDGEVTPLPTVDGIYVDGKLVEDFEAKVTGYSYLMPTKATAPAQVTVATSNKYEIVQAPAIGEDAIIKVYSPISDAVYRVYRVNFWQKAPLGDIDGMRRYPVAKGTSSSNATETNIPDASMDGDFKTWWSAVAADKEAGQWLMYELDDVYLVEKIGIAWYNGGNRTGKYKLEISEDGVNWTTIYSGDTLKYDLDKYEFTHVGGKNVKFVKVTGFGTDVNDYVMVGEMVVLGNQR